MKLSNLIATTIVFVLLAVLWSVANGGEQRTGNGLTFKGRSVAMAIPQGHQDFTTWNINSKTLTQEVVLLGLVLSGFGHTYYELIACENKARVLALHFHSVNEDFYWLYPTNITLVKTTRDEFEKMKTEAQYLCPAEMNTI